MGERMENLVHSKRRISGDAPITCPPGRVRVPPFPKDSLDYALELTKCKESDTISLLIKVILTKGTVMKEILSTITSKGQVTIPIEVRKHLGLKTNDKVAFVIDSEGKVLLKVPRYSDVASLSGAAGSLDKPLSWQQMREIAYEDRFKAKH